jgi:hypothetical protein
MHASANFRGNAPGEKSISGAFNGGGVKKTASSLKFNFGDSIGGAGGIAVGCAVAKCVGKHGALEGGGGSTFGSNLSSSNGGGCTGTVASMYVCCRAVSTIATDAVMSRLPASTFARIFLAFFRALSAPGGHK